MQAPLAMLGGGCYGAGMTTNPTPCRCGHVDRTKFHSCRQVRLLAEFRASLLASLVPAVDTDDDGFANYDYDAEARAEMAAERHYEQGPDDGFDAYEARTGAIDFATAWDLADPTRTAPCARHGAPKVHGTCWECNAEAEIARRDRNEYAHLPV